LGTDHGRFAGQAERGKPGFRQVWQHHKRKVPGTETPAADRPPARGFGQTAGAEFRDAIQRLTLAWEGLEGAARPSISMQVASTGLAIGWGVAPRASRANLETAGEEFA